MKDKEQRDKTGTDELLAYANNIIATLREPFLVLDKKLRIITANNAFYSTFKVTKKDTIGQSLPDLGDRQWNIPKLLLLLKDIIPQKRNVNDFEVEHEFKKIGKRVMVLNARQLRISKRIEGILSTGIREPKVKEKEEERILLAIEDITEQRHLQDELKASEERYRRAFETSANVLLLVHKTEGDILSSNASARKLLGYSQKELLKKKLWEIGAVKNACDFHDVVSTLEKEGVVHYQDTPILTQKGLLINTEVFLVDKSKVIQCNISDITKRKEAEEIFRETEMRFKTIFNESSDGMLLAEAGTGRFFMCNPKICEMLGYTEKELMRMGVDDIHPKGDLPFVIEQFERQAQGEIRLAAGLPVKRKDGSIFYADVSTSRITLPGKIQCFLRSFSDITESKKMQDELIEKMQDLERFSRFAVDRELKMEELEKKLKELEQKLKAR